MRDSLSIQWLISTCGEGIYRVKSLLLPPEQGVSYVVSWQTASEMPPDVATAFDRPDVTLSPIHGLGLSANRNNALKQASAEILVLADDDVGLKPTYAYRIRRVFERYPKVDVACFQIRTGTDEPDYKHYPKRAKRLHSLSAIKGVSSIEMAFRKRVVEGSGLRFDERFGLGTRADCGEEYLFLADCLRKGLHVHFFPIYTVEHPCESSVKKRSFLEDGRLFVTGAQNYVLFGRLAYLWHALALLRRLPALWRTGVSPRRFLAAKNAGCRYIRRS
jgi:glycosyltransferase involved in cell wall biosynthesis